MVTETRAGHTVSVGTEATDRYGELWWWSCSCGQISPTTFGTEAQADTAAISHLTARPHVPAPRR